MHGKTRPVERSGSREFARLKPAAVSGWGKSGSKATPEAETGTRRSQLKPVPGFIRHGVRTYQCPEGRGSALPAALSLYLWLRPMDNVAENGNDPDRHLLSGPGHRGNVV